MKLVYREAFVVDLDAEVLSEVEASKAFAEIGALIRGYLKEQNLVDQGAEIRRSDGAK